MRFRKVSLEDGFAGHVFNGGSGLRMSEKGFREEDDELVVSFGQLIVIDIAYRFSELSLVLSPQDVEVVGWCSSDQHDS